MNKKIIKAIAVVLACLGVTAFAGCHKKENTQNDGNVVVPVIPGGDTKPDDKNPDQTEKPDDENPDQTEKPDDKNPDQTEKPDDEKPEPDKPGDENPEPDKPSDETPAQPDQPGGEEPEPQPSPSPEPEQPGDEEPEPEPAPEPEPEPEQPGDPEINQPVANGIEILSVAGDLEAAYVTWKPVANAVSYSVYYKKDNGSEVKIDQMLIRRYAEYVRADIVGLSAGTYSVRIVPVDYTEAEVSSLGNSANNISVSAHIREGFAFVDGTSSGAYNEDGTLKSGAQVIYVTENTKNTVSMNVTGADSNPCVGIQAILNGYAKGKENTPLAVRLIGNITDPAVLEKGDLLVDNKNNATPGITIEGIGEDAVVNGWGIRLKNASNVEIRNLGFMNCNSNEGDNLGLQQGNDHIWTHNNDLFYGDAGSDADQVKGDGALDTKKSTYVTHSFNHFWDNGKCNLQGMKDEKTTNMITYHHNWYDHSDSRHPRIRTCTVHIYNNYFDGNAKYGVGVTMGASAFVENNYFRSTSTMKPMLSSGQGTDALGEGTFSGESGGIIKSYGNYFDGRVNLITQNDTADKTNIDCYAATSRGETVPSDYSTKVGGTTYNNFDTAANMYSYNVQSAEAAKESVIAHAGRIGGGDFKWTFNNATADSDYSVDTQLKNMLTNYKTKLLQVYGDAASGQTPGGDVGGGETGGGESGGGENGGETGGGVQVEGVITYYPYSDGYAGSYNGLAISGTSSNKSEEVYINGVTVPEKKALKMDSSGKVVFTPSQNMTLTLYVMLNSIKLNGQKLTNGVAGEDYYIFTIDVNAGTEYTVAKGDGENALYGLILTPKA